MRGKEVAGGIHLWNIVVLAKRLELRVEVVNAVLMRLSCQFFHLIGKLRGYGEYKIGSNAKQTRAPVSAGPPGNVSQPLSFVRR